MFRSGRTTLLGLVLAAPMLVTVPHAMAAQSHLDASSDTGAIADETSDAGNVSYLGSGIDAWASASSLALRSSCSADSDDGHLDFCDVLTTFSNVARIDPGSSGRSNGDAVTLALTVNLEGALLATYTGPSNPEDEPPSFIGSALLNAQVKVTAPDRPSAKRTTASLSAGPPRSRPSTQRRNARRTALHPIPSTIRTVR